MIMMHMKNTEQPSQLYFSLIVSINTMYFTLVVINKHNAIPLDCLSSFAKRSQKLYIWDLRTTKYM